MNQNLPFHAEIIMKTMAWTGIGSILPKGHDSSMYSKWLNTL
jgi:hypothetical protein